MDAVNAFVYAEIYELVYIRLSPGFGQQNRVAKLNTALYDIQQSPLLWQTKFMTALKDLGFSEIPQEPCIMIRGGIICFSFMDDIVFAFQKQDLGSITQATLSLRKQFMLKELGELKWF